MQSFIPILQIIRKPLEPRLYSRFYHLIVNYVTQTLFTLILVSSAI
jgi:hypothetical protein